MDFTVVYHLESAHQFWSELEDILYVPPTATLSRLDASLCNFVSFCADYHQKYLQTTLQLEHACNLLLDSDLFSFHSERMSDLVIENATTNTDPHSQLILHSILLLYGRRHPAFLRSHAKWKGLIPILMDHILVEIDDSNLVSGGNLDIGSRNSLAGLGVPIEVRLRCLAVGILYEVCRVQKMDGNDLRVFDNFFISHLFNLVEQTRNIDDETFNYSVVKLIIALNEQFMVASIILPHPHVHSSRSPVADTKGQNRVLQTLMGRLGDSKTFGENTIFMLNRADGSPEAMVMQLLLLKMLYLLFTTSGTREYFYTNDLRVLVDVFIRKLSDLPEENESLRHTYLRVLHPLLTNTQLRTVSYKRRQIRQLLQSLIAHSHIRDISPTTKRLVGRCMSAEWCLELDRDQSSEKSPTSSIASGFPLTSQSTAVRSQLLPVPPKFKTIHRSVSVEVLNASTSSSAFPDSAGPSRMSSDTPVTNGNNKIMKSEWCKSMTSLCVSSTPPSAPSDLGCPNGQRPRHKSEISSQIPVHNMSLSATRVGGGNLGVNNGGSKQHSWTGTNQISSHPTSAHQPQDDQSAPPVSPPRRRKPPAVPAGRGAKMASGPDPPPLRNQLAVFEK